MYALQRTMRGETPTLKDIVLFDIPTCETPIDLYCYEQLDSSDEDDQAKQDIQRYKILCMCTQCYKSVKLVVQCTEADIRNLQQMLLGTLDIVCPLCARVE